MVGDPAAFYTVLPWHTWEPMTRLFIAFSLVLALLPTTITAGAAGSTNVLLARGRTEPVVAVDPRNPKTVVVASNTNYSAPQNGSFPTAYFASHDAGRSFLFGNAPQVAPYSTGADPGLSIDASGTSFYSYLGETPSYCSGGHSAIIVSHSTDGGRSFHSPRVVDVDSADDRPSIAVESIPNHPSHVFVAWSRYHDSTNRSDVWYARSSDGASSFGPPHLLVSSSLNNVAATPVVGVHGRIYVFWNAFPSRKDTLPGPSRIMIRESTNDGRSFGPMRPASPAFTEMPLMVSPGSLRDLTAPAAGSDSRGDLYLAWSQVSRRYRDGHVDADIVLSRSQNGGRTWSHPRRVNDSRHLDRFMPALSLFPGRSVGIAFYDRRAGPWDLGVYAARVSFTNGFHVSKNVRVNAGRSPVGDIYYIRPGSSCFLAGRFFGDYIGAAATGAGRLCISWTDTRMQVANETDVWFASVPLSAPSTVRHSQGVRSGVNTMRGPRSYRDRDLSFARPESDPR